MKNIPAILKTFTNIVWDFVSPKILNFRYFLSRKYKLVPPVPNPKINFNQPINHLNINRYCEEFASASSSSELPFLKQIASLNEESITLDFGCGLGRLANAFYSKGGIVGSYYGWEPNQVALGWLNNAYADNSRFRFGGSELNPNQTYLSGDTAFSNFETDLALPDKSKWEIFVKDVKFDLIWTHSVFTHMFPETAVEVLKLFKSVAKPGTWIINTFLCIDDATEKALKSKSADREFLYIVNGVHVFSETNPLSCTGYEIGTLRKIYRDAGLPNPIIRHGSWAGKNNGVTYMDLVIAQIPQP